MKREQKLKSEVTGKWAPGRPSVAAELKDGLSSGRLQTGTPKLNNLLRRDPVLYFHILQRGASRQLAQGPMSQVEVLRLVEALPTDQLLDHITAASIEETPAEVTLEQASLLNASFSIPECRRTALSLCFFVVIAFGMFVMK